MWNLIGIIFILGLILATGGLILALILFVGAFVFFFIKEIIKPTPEDQIPKIKQLEFLRYKPGTISGRIQKTLYWVALILAIFVLAMMTTIILAGG